MLSRNTQKEEEIGIPRYSQIFRNGRSGNSGGILLAVKEHKNSYIRGFSAKENWTKLVNIAR